MRSPVFRRPGCRRHAGTTKRRPKYATPEVVAGRHCTTRLCFTPLTHKVIHVKPRREHSPAPPPGCDCVQERFGTPRMSPRPRVAKYGVTHGCHHLRGGGNARLRSLSPPLAEMRTLRMLVTWSGAHFKNRNKNPISSSEVTASLRMYLGALPPHGAGHFFATAPLRLAPSTHPQRRALWQYCVFCLHI